MTFGLSRGSTSARTVFAVGVAALALHLLWLRFLAGTGGDLAAQDAWTGFALAHPDSAYDFSWYGGMHPASYSLVSPYVMSARRGAGHDAGRRHRVGCAGHV